MLRFWQVGGLMGCLLLGSCGTSDRSAEGDLQDEANSPMWIPPSLRKKEDGVVELTPGGNARGPVPIGGNLRPDEVVWTNPDDPDADIPELEGLFEEAQKAPSAWLLSETVAIRQSKASGKPILIWFADKQGSAPSNLLQQELFNRSEFDQWAKEHVVRLLVDRTVQERNMKLQEEKREWVEKMRKRYKILGSPTLLVVAPSGEVIGRYRGYSKGKPDFTWGQIRQGASVAQNRYDTWKASLEKKGYRMWSDGRGKSVFARLVNYHQGTLYLLEPDGQRLRTSESSLCQEDRDWIAAEKKKRGIE